VCVGKFQSPLPHPFSRASYQHGHAIANGHEKGFPWRRQKTSRQIHRDASRTRFKIRMAFRAFRR
jgi:hypothetical protein